MLEKTLSSEQEKHYRELLARATETMRLAHAPYSNFRVGAAVEMEDGTVFTGCNVENRVISLGICAERTAFVKAISQGKTNFSTVAIVAERAKNVWPCGLCRQFMSEFGADIKIIVETESQQLVVRTVRELIPNLEHNG